MSDTLPKPEHHAEPSSNETESGGLLVGIKNVFKKIRSGVGKVLNWFMPDKEAAEAKEVPEILTVARACNNENGRWIGLSKLQRKAKHVSEKEEVELFEDGHSLGLFKVGQGAKELVDMPDQFTANGIDPGKKVTIKKVEASCAVAT